jgi:hypothetical protein
VECGDGCPSGSAATAWRAARLIGFISLAGAVNAEDLDRQ